MLVHAYTLISFFLCIFGWTSRPDKQLVIVFFLLYVHLDFYVYLSGKNFDLSNQRYID
jgi:hypothetical protein